MALQWRHHERHGILNQRRLDCAFNRLFKRASKKTSKSLVFVRGIHRWPMDSPHKGASNAKNVPIWWRHRGICDGSSQLRSQGLPRMSVLYCIPWSVGFADGSVLCRVTQQVLCCYSRDELKNLSAMDGRCWHWKDFGKCRRQRRHFVRRYIIWISNINGSRSTQMEYTVNGTPLC